MNTQPSDAVQAGRLIHWGLQVKERPALHAEYKELLDRYQDRTDFRSLTNQIAEGLGLTVLDWGDHGLVLGPSPDSVFALRGASFRSNRQDADDRLLDGLVQVAIATAVFPTPRELEEEATVARPPVTVEEVDEVLRRLCQQFAEGAQREGDLVLTDEVAGLHEAWRAYQRRLSVHQTRDNKQGPRSTQRIIQRNLDRLHDLGCFIPQRSDPSAYQATWRYQVLVKELAATALYQRIRDISDSEVEAPLSET
jgi:hypothetical protein